MPRPNEHRQTLLPTTASLDGVGLTSPQHRLAEKQRELLAFHRLRSQCREMSGNFDDLGVQLGNLAGGGEALERVVENWANVFRAVHLAVGSTGARQGLEAGAAAPSSELPECLVRIPTQSHQPL